MTNNMMLRKCVLVTLYIGMIYSFKHTSEKKQQKRKTWMNVLDGLAYCHLKKSIKKRNSICLRTFFLSPESTHNLFLSLAQHLKSHAYREKNRNIGALHNVSIARQQETNLFYLSILLIRVNIEFKRQV